MADETQAETSAEKPDLAKAAESMIAKQGDPVRVIMTLMSENYNLRDKARELSAKLPKEGEKVLSPDEIKSFEKYRSLGDIQSLESSLREKATLAEELGRHNRRATAVKAAKLSGLDPDLLAEIALDKGIEFSFKQSSKDGKAVETALVKDADDKEVPIDQFVSQRLAVYADALKPKKPLETGPSRQVGNPMPVATGSRNPSPAPASRPRF